MQVYVRIFKGNLSPPRPGHSSDAGGATGRPGSKDPRQSAADHQVAIDSCAPPLRCKLGPAAPTYGLWLRRLPPCRASRHQVKFSEDWNDETPATCTCSLGQALVPSAKGAPTLQTLPLQLHEAPPPPEPPGGTGGAAAQEPQAEPQEVPCSQSIIVH